MGARLLSVPFGEPATAALARLVGELRGGDPLAPLTVAVPSAAAGTTLRRRLAADTGGVVAVAFESLPQVAARLAPGAPPPLPSVVLRGHIRAALRDLDGGPLARAAASPATERALDLTVRELADLDDATLAALAAEGGVAGATARVAQAVRRAPAAAGAAPGGSVVRAAAEAVAAGAAPLGAVGPLVVHLPRHLRAAELELLAALVRAGHPVAVTVGRTGDPVADEPGAELLAAAAAALGVEPEVLPGAEAPPTPDLLVRTPDPDEEVACAIRLVLDALTTGEATAPERIAVCYRVAEPYATLLHEQLAAAGVRHHAPTLSTLAHSVAGRVLLGALALPHGGWRRAQVVGWWRSGPVRDLATGRRVPVARWDRLAREAGVVCGLDQWRTRLAQAVEEREQALAQRAPAAEQPGEDDEEDRRLRDLRDLAAAVGALADALQPPGEPTWAAWSRWARDLLRRALGTPSPEAGWSAEELEAHHDVQRAVADLARLDGVDTPPDLARFRLALAEELDRTARRHGRFGHGVTVGPLLDAVGADLDLVVVVGAAEGSLPPRGREDALVPDHVRRRLGGRVRPRRRSRGEEHRDLLAALAAGRRRVLVCPRSDPRDQRERQPAPAFLEAARALAGRFVAGGDLDRLRGTVPWFVDVESFEWWPATGRAGALPTDPARAALLADHRAGRPVTGSAPAVAGPALGRALACGIARREGTLGGWAGDVGSRPELLDGFDRPRSPTSLQDYATCPFRYFLRSVLRVRALDDPTDADEIPAHERGGLVHRALERFFDERGIGKPPEEPWSPDDRERLRAIAAEEAGALAEAGRTGRPRLWEVHREQLRRRLDAVLDADEVLRRRFRSTPIAVEWAFGFDVEGSGPAAELDAGDGRRVAFRGVIDRIDRTADGGLLVLDYKTGSAASYRDLDRDVTAHGTRLQLGVYALAARALVPDATSVDARYWFLDERGEQPVLRGRPFDPTAEQRFRDVVATLLDGIVAGRFPANPGDERWWWGRYVHDNCRRCDYEPVCPTTRGRRWQQLRAHPALAGYVALAEGPLPGEVEEVGVEVGR